MKPWHLYVAALVLFIAGACMIAVPHIGPPPEVTCVEEGQPTSGFAIERDGQECPLSTEDFLKYWEWETNSARPVRLAGLGVDVISIGTAIAGVVVQVKRRKRRRLAARAQAPGGLAA